MRLSYKLLVLLALAALASLSCKAVTGLVGDSTPGPNNDAGRGGLVFKPDQLPDAQVGEEYKALITVEGAHTPVGQFSLQEGQYPPGLELTKRPGEENAAEIHGTPTQPGTYKFVLHVWCYGTQKSGQTGEKEYTIVVK